MIGLRQPTAHPTAAIRYFVISELVTNAVVHARSAPEIVASVRKGVFRVEVYDDDRRPPVVRLSGNAVDGGGSGLRIVSGLSDRWGGADTDRKARVGGGPVLARRLADGISRRPPHHRARPRARR